MLLPRITLAAALALAPAAQAQSSDQNMRRFYDGARRCFIANTHFAGGFRDAGDKANEQLFEARAKKSYDVAFYSGRQLGLREADVQRDIDASMRSELRQLMTNSAYLTDTAKFCKERGLM